MAAGKWIVRIWKSGVAGDMSKFYTAANQKPKSSREQGSSTTKKDANGSQAVRRLARIVNCNFGHGDCLLTLKYDAAGMEMIGGDFKAAEKQMMKFLGRMGYRYHKRDVKFCYIGMTSEKSSRTLEPARLHHHVVVSGNLISKPEGSAEYLIAGEPISKVWGLGSVDVQPIRKESDHTGLAVYLCKQARCLPNEKRWHPSRNLDTPEWVDVELTTAAVAEYNRHRRKGMPRLVISRDGKLMVPPKCVMVEDGQYLPAIGTHYIRFVMPEVKRPETHRRKGEAHELL